MKDNDPYIALKRRILYIFWEVLKRIVVIRRPDLRAYQGP